MGRKRKRRGRGTWNEEEEEEEEEREKDEEEKGVIEDQESMEQIYGANLWTLINHLRAQVL